MVKNKSCNFVFIFSLYNIYSEVLAVKKSDKKCKAILSDKERNARKHVKKCLYAYKQLQANIERCKKDIEDVKHEDLEHSKSIVFMNAGGQRLTVEERREAKIISIKQDMNRDQQALDKINKALDDIKNDEDYGTLCLLYIEGKTQAEVSETMHYDPTTLWRRVGRLLDILAIRLYGADAIEI